MEFLFNIYKERSIKTLYTPIIVIISIFCFFAISSAKSGQEHFSDYKQWFGGGVIDDVSKDLNSIAIDTVPWFKGNSVGGGGHRVQWGHTIEWYYGEKPNADTINAIKNWKGSKTTTEEAIRLYQKYLPKGGGKELLVKRIRKAYPRLRRKHAEILADTVFYSHLEGDMKTAEGLNLNRKLKNEILTRLKNPPLKYIETVLSLDAAKVEGKNTSDKAIKFVNTPKNQERLAATQIAKTDRSVKISNPKDKNFIGIEKNGKKYILCRGNKSRMTKILTRYKDYRIMITDDLFEKLKNDPNFSELIQAGKIIPEGDILSNKSILESNKSNLQKKSEQIIAQGEGLYASSKLKAYYERIPKDVRLSIKAGIVVSVFSGLGNTWNVISGEKEIDEAVIETLGTGVHAGTSIYITNAIIQRVGDGQYALTAIVDSSGKELMPNVSKLVAAKSAFLNYGVATFIFDQSRSIFFFAKGNMDANEFIETTGKNVLASTGSGIASWCAVALGYNPAGFTVMAISIGGYLVVNKTISYAEKLNKRNYFFIEDVLGHLPLEMQRRVTPWDLGDRITPWDRDDKITPWNQPEKQTPWNGPQNVTPWD